jgi:hypothetical protein
MPGLIFMERLVARRRGIFDSAFFIAALLLAVSAAAQTTEKTAVQPIECWWRTSANSVRVGQLFDVILTCAVLDTSATTVVPDQSRLDPSVLQLPPFEVTGGSQAADLKTPSRRFFQYEYVLRYIGEDFGRDVALPSLAVSYRVQSRVEKDAAAIESRDRQYFLPPQTIRIESLVPLDARDIRDRAPDTFRAIEQRRFRATVLRIIAISLMIVSGAMVVWGLVRYISRRRVKTAERARLVSDGIVLREVERELEAVRRGRQMEGWTPALAARALAAMRVAAAYAVSGHAAQSALTPDTKLSEGQILVRPRLQAGKAAVVSGSATAVTVAHEIRRREALKGSHTAPLVDLQHALQQLSIAAYGQTTPADGDLDDAMNSGERALRVIQREHRWLAKRLAGLRRSFSGARSRAWAR